VSAKSLLVYGLARNRRSAKRPSEPRPSGVHPEEGEVEKDGAAFLVGLSVGLKKDGLQKLAQPVDAFGQSLECHHLNIVCDGGIAAADI
jgi:hypothetical protein